MLVFVVEVPDCIVHSKGSGDDELIYSLTSSADGVVRERLIVMCRPSIAIDTFRGFMYPNVLASIQTDSFTPYG